LKIIRKLVISETEIQHEKLANIFDLFIIKTFCDIVSISLINFTVPRIVYFKSHSL